MVEYECDGQMTIFDYLKPEYPDINDIEEEEAVRIVGEALGLRFFQSRETDNWRCLTKGMVLKMRYGHFCLDDNHDLFLDTSWDTRNAGGGAPLSGIEEAVNYFRRKIDDHTQGII